MVSILVVAELYWPEDGGAELATHLIIDILRREFDVTVVTGSKNTDALSGVKYVYEPLLVRREKPVLWLNSLWPMGAERFRDLLRRHDIVYIPKYALPIIPVARKLGRKVVVHLHDYIPISYTAVVLAPYEEHSRRMTRDNVMMECGKGLKYCVGIGAFWWFPRLARRWVSQADKVVCVSRRQAEIIASQVPELEGKVEVIYNPLPPELANAEPRKDLDSVPTFLYVGGDSYVKGFHILLQALKELGKQGIKARFILTNRYSPRNLEILKRLSEKYRNLEIQVVGRVDYEELLEIRKKAWALLFPSIWEEPLPYSIVEAMLMGTVPVASKVGGVPEIIEKSPAKELLFAPNDLEEFVENMIVVASMSPEQLVKLGFSLRNSILKRFDNNITSKELIRIFNT